MNTKPAGELTAGDQFVDPRREGRRTARVVTVDGADSDRIHLTLDDDTTWGPWAASYRLDEQLELI